MPHRRQLLLAAIAGVIGCWWRRRQRGHGFGWGRAAVAAAAGALALLPVWRWRRRRFRWDGLHTAFAAGAAAGGVGYEAALGAVGLFKDTRLRAKNSREGKRRWIG